MIRVRKPGTRGSPRAEEESNDEPQLTKSNELMIKCVGICEKAGRAIVANVSIATGSTKSRHASLNLALRTEMKLWGSIQTFKETRDEAILHFINGFYSTLLTEVIGLVC